MEISDKIVYYKILNMLLINEIRKSYSYLELLDKQIKLYQNRINYLENNKPFFFQKRKLEEYNKKIEDYEHKIYNLYEKIDDEIDFIYQMQCNIDIN